MAKLRRFSKRALLAALAVGLLLTAWALVEPYLLEVVPERAEVPGLDESWRGATVAVTGDFQVGFWGDNQPTVEETARRIVEADPALVLLTGDFVYHLQQDLESTIDAVVERLGPLFESDIPVYAVLGNHDWSLTDSSQAPTRDSGRAVRRVLEEHGVTLLHNEAVRVTPDGRGPLWIVGLGSRWAGHDDASAALAGVPDGAPRLVVMHHPQSFEDLPAHAAPLAVAGHTHGGQLRVPFMPEWSWIEVMKRRQIHADGWAEGIGAEGNRLYVNRGIGMSLLPARVHCRPELTLFELHPDPAKRAPPLARAP